MSSRPSEACSGLNHVAPRTEAEKKAYRQNAGIRTRYEYLRASCAHRQARGSEINDPSQRRHVDFRGGEVPAFTYQEKSDC